MSKALESKVNELFAATKDLKSLEEIKPYCEAFNNWVSQQNYSDKSLGTLFSRYGLYSKFRNLELNQGENAELVAKHDGEGKVKGHELKHYVPLLCGLDQKDWEARNATTRAIARVGEGKELDPDTYLETTGNLLASRHPYEVAVGLIAATGRRPHEILARATFTAVKGKDYVVRFGGQGKKRGEKPVFEIPVLFPARYIVERLKYLRSDSDMQLLLSEIEQEFSSLTKQNVELDKRRNKSLNRVVQEYFKVLELRHDDINQNNKSLRAAYAALVTERDCDGGLGAKILFASRLLGHFQVKEEDDRSLVRLGTTIGYLDYVVKKPVPFIKLPKPQAIRNLRAFQNDFETILKFQKEWGLTSQPEIVAKLLEPFEKDVALRNELLAERSKNAQLETKITELEAQIIQLEEKPEMPASFDPEAFKVAFKAEILDCVSKIVADHLFNLNKIGNENPIIQSKPVQPQAKEEIDWESKSHTELWTSKASGAAEEKIRRSFQAITAYNDTIATGDDDRLAITNQALRTLSGVNGLLVGDWIKGHTDEVVSHNAKYGMQNAKDPAKVETYYNKRHGQEKIEKILELINNEFLEGVALGKKAAA